VLWSLAAESSHEALVELLLDKGANIEAADNYGRAALSYAARNKHQALVNLLKPIK
jgi:ankyrin repeat protein